MQFIQHFGYWIAVPIMVVEGPIITLIMGFLASFGYFNPAVVVAFAVTADLISDAFYYWSGYHGGDRVLAKLKIPMSRDNQTLQRFRQRFESHPGKIFFVSKILPGITFTTMVLAGGVKVRYFKVLRYALLGGIVWSSILTAIGFFFGRQAANIHKVLSWTGVLFFIGLALFLFYEFWFGRFLAKKFAVWRQNGNQD